MPTLTATENPSAIYPEGSLVPQLEGEWFVLQTQHRHEKALAFALAELHLPYYLPMYRQWSRSGGRRVMAHIPAFPGYLFACTSRESLADAKSVFSVKRHLSNVITVNQQKRLVKDLLNLQHAIDAGATLLQHEGLRPGRRCQIIDGPLEGLDGVLIDADGDTKFVLQIETLGRAVPVEIAHPEWLEPI